MTALTCPARPAGAATSELARLDALVEGSIYKTVVGSTGAVGEVLSANVQRLLMWHLNLVRQVHRGDRLRLLYDPATGEIEALAYTSKQLKGEIKAFRFRPYGDPYPRYYDERGVEHERRLKHSPLADHEQITALIGDGRRHHGMDFKAPVGTPVRLPFKARVQRRNWRRRANGRCLDVTYLGKHASALFLHLDRVADVARPGAVLPAGTIIAYTGNTGHSTAPHLHYQVMDSKGRVVDPRKLHGTQARRLPPASRADFDAARRRLDRLLVGRGGSKPR